MLVGGEVFSIHLPRLSVVEGLSTYVLEWLAIGRVDCAVVYNVAPSAAMARRCGGPKNFRPPSIGPGLPACLRSFTA